MFKSCWRRGINISVLQSEVRHTKKEVRHTKKEVRHTKKEGTFHNIS